MGIISTPVAPIGAIRIAYNQGRPVYQQIKVEWNGKTKWVYLQRELMRQHLGRELKDTERVLFKEDVDPLGVFTADDLYIETVAPIHRYNRMKALERRIRVLKLQLSDAELELESYSGSEDDP